jgi:hypothetical protein
MKVSLAFPIAPFLIGLPWDSSTFSVLRAMAENIHVGTAWPETVDAGGISVVTGRDCLIRAIRQELVVELPDDVAKTIMSRVVAERPYTLEDLFAECPGMNFTVRKQGREWRVEGGGTLAVEPTLDAALRDVKKQAIEMRPKKPTGKALTTEKPKRSGRDE